jgi:predicted nucleotidyltransferase
MIPILARREAERRARIDLARSWATELDRRLAGRVRLVAAVVVGSVARGDFNLWSDLDVLVVADGLPASGRARLDLLMRHAPPGLQAIGWQPEELAERLGRRDPLALEALRAGVVGHGELPALPTPEPA